MVNPRIVVGAHYGFRDWLMQRITAVVLILYTLIFLGVLLANPQLDYTAWKALFSKLFFKLATFVTLICLFLHAWVGVRDIWMDYIKPTGLRLTLQVLTIGVLLAFTGWAIHILWGMH